MTTIRAHFFLAGMLASHGALACDALPAQPTAAQVTALVACVRAVHVQERVAIPRFVARWEGTSENPAQSLTPVPPFEPYPVVFELGVDGEKSTTLQTVAVLPGGFEFRNLFVQGEDGKVVDYDLVRRFRTDAPGLPPSVLRLDPLRLADQLVAAKLAWVETRADGLVLIEATRENGTQFEASIEPAAARIVRFRQALPAGFQGTAMFEVELAYDDAEPRHIPIALDITVNPEKLGAGHNVIKRTSFERVAPKSIADYNVAGFGSEDRGWRPARAVEKLSDRAWLLRNLTETTAQWSYNVIAVKDDAGWWVLEAPVSAEVTAWVVAELEKLAPGLPVAGVVQSHHHHDHVSGIEPYLATSEIVSTPAVATLLDQRYGYANVKAVAGDASRTIGDLVRVFSLGAEPHAGAMLVSYLPQERTLLQSDLVNLREYPDNAASEHFRDWVRKSGLAVDRIVGVHGDVLAGDELAKWLAP